MPEIPPKIVGDGPVQGTVMVDNGTGELLMVPVETAKNLGISMPGQPQPPTTPPSAVNQPLDFSDILSQGVPGQAQPDQLLANVPGGVPRAPSGQRNQGAGTRLGDIMSEGMETLFGSGSPSSPVQQDTNVHPPGVLGRDTRRADAPLSEPATVGTVEQAQSQGPINASPGNVGNLSGGQLDAAQDRFQEQGQLDAAGAIDESLQAGRLALQGGGRTSVLQGPARRDALAQLQAMRAQANDLGTKLGILRQEEEALTREGGDIQEKGAIGVAEEIEGLIAQSELIEQQRLDDRERQEKEVAAEMAHLSSMMENLSTQRVDPNRLFAGTPARLSAAIGAGVGAALSAAERMTFGTDGGNVALGIINEAIERDVQAQIVNYNRASGEAAQQSSFIGLLRQRTGDIDAAADLARSVQTDIAVKELTAMRSRTRGAAQQNAIDLLINTMRAQSDAGKLQGIQAAMVANTERLNATRRTGPSMRNADRLNTMGVRSHDALATEAGEGGRTDAASWGGGAFSFPPGTMPLDLDDTLNRQTLKNVTAVDSLGRLARAYERGIGTADDLAEFRGAYAASLQTIVRATNVGVAAEGDVARSAEQLGGTIVDPATGNIQWGNIPYGGLMWNSSQRLVEQEERIMREQTERQAAHGSGISDVTFIPRGQRASSRLGIRDE